MKQLNGRSKKVIGGISITTLIAIIGFVFLLSDRAKESGAAKATTTMEVKALDEKVDREIKAVSGRVDHLEGHADETEKTLNGKDGLVATVEVVKNRLTNIENQGKAILDEIKALSKK